MLQRVRDIIEKVKTEFAGDQGHAVRCALDLVLRELDKIEPIEGVWVEDYKIEIFDPKTGEGIVCWNQPTRGMVDTALAVRTFYAEGPEALKKIVKKD